MQSYSINIAHDIDCFDPFSNECIKSLSEDDSDDEKEYIEYEVEANKHLIQDDDDNKDEDDDDDETTLKEKEKEKEEEYDYDNNLLLDKDIEIAKMLNKTGYFKVSKLCFTDQGSVWRAKSPKKFGSKSVVIKIASKLHYKCPDDENVNNCSEHENILKEIDLLQRINKKQKECISDNVQNSIIEIIDTMDNDDNYMAVLEDGGNDLYKFIKQCHEEIRREKITIGEWQKTIKLISLKLIELIHWLHDKMNVCHLDISLENVLISNINWVSYPDQYKNYKKRLAPDFRLKLIDFGAAKQFVEKDDDGNIIYNSLSIIGKPYYCSPQIYKLQNKLSKQSFDARKADIWSYGVSIFIMALGCPPWERPDERSNKLFQTIVSEKNGLDFVLKGWKRSNYIDETLKDLLQKIFVITEKNRISTNDIMKHSWLC